MRKSVFIFLILALVVRRSRRFFAMKKYQFLLSIILFVFGSNIVFAEGSFSSYDFFPIKSYFRTYKLSYETNDDFIAIPGAGGIISDFPIKSDVGTEIEFSLRSTFDSIKEKTWVPSFRLYFYERKLDPAKEYLEYAEKTNFIELVVRATTFSDPDYKGNPYDTKVSRSTYESVTEDKKQYHTPLQWNKIKIVISDRKTIRIFVNGKESLIYRGSFPENIFLGIGNNQDMYGFYVGRDVYINGKTGKINLKPGF